MTNMKKERYRLSPVKAMSFKERYATEGAVKSDGKTRPTFHLTSKEVPEIRDWQQGKEYLARIRMAGKTETTGDSDGDGKRDPDVSGTFEIVAVGPDGGGGKAAD